MADRSIFMRMAQLKVRLMKESWSIWERLKYILMPERSFYFTSVVYSLGVSILSLAIPISVQSLVNTVSFGILTQPLIVLSIVLLGLLLISGALKALRVYVLELFQRQFYARTTSDIALRVLNSEHRSFKEANGEEVTNRYFDVMTVQKKATLLLTDGLAFVLQTVVGLLLLGFYHPYFLIFDLILIGLIYFVITFFGKAAIETAIQESKVKYEVADWLNEMGRVDLFFKSKKRKDFAIGHSDELINKYLKKRSRHFRELFTQTVILLFIYAFMSALTLGLGGYLVIDGQITLGQLVAAELVVTVILSSFSKMGKYLESFYDLCAAVEKISKFYELPLENNERPFVSTMPLRDLELQSVKHSSGNYNYVYDYHFKEEKVYYVSTVLNSCKIICMNVIAAVEAPDQGEVILGGINYDEMNPIDIRDHIYIVGKANLFGATLSSNLNSVNCTISQKQIDTCLRIVGLEDVIDRYEEAMELKILPSGYPLWSSQTLRMEIAKSLLSDSSILIYTEVFDQIEKTIRGKILDYAKQIGKTVIVFSNKAHHNFTFNKYLSLDAEGFHEFDSPESIFKARK